MNEVAGNGTAAGSLVILCEGQGDEAFFRNLIAQRGLPGFKIIFPNDKPGEGIPGGRPGFGGRLSALRAEKDFEKVGGILIVSDNDDEPERSFKEVQAQVGAAGGYPIPAQPLEVVRGGAGPAIVAMMLPGAGQPGNLETLCVAAMRDAWPQVGACTDEFCNCTGTSAWGPSKRAKMSLRAMISAVCKSDPNTSLVYAWARAENLIALGHSAFNEIAEVLRGFKERVSRVR